jgi:hypothetical protein
LNKVIATITTKTSSIFLIIVLVAVTFTAIFPSFINGEVQAQSEPEYGYDDDDNYNSEYYPLANVQSLIIAEYSLRVASPNTVTQ